MTCLVGICNWCTYIQYGPHVTMGDTWKGRVRNIHHKTGKHIHMHTNRENYPSLWIHLSHWGTFDEQMLNMLILSRQFTRNFVTREKADQICPFAKPRFRAGFCYACQTFCWHRFTTWYFCYFFETMAAWFPNVVDEVRCLSFLAHGPQFCWP